MYLKQFVDERCGCASYLIASRRSGEAVVVDPGLLLDPYEEVLRERGFRLRRVIDSHVHADHVSGARRLAAAHDAELCLHESAGVAYPFRPLRDGEELALGAVRLRVLHTPGHRPELISLLVANLDRAAEPQSVLTGDSLLVGDVGRPDFGGGDAAAQFASVRRLLALPDWVAHFPGHVDGPCGAGMEGRASSTIGYERRFNPFATLDRADFVARLTASIPPRPLNTTAIEATNRGTADLAWAMPTASPPVAEIPVADLAAILDREPTAHLLDVREPAEYTRGHLPSAVNLPLAEIATRLAEIPRDRALFLVCHSGARSLRAGRFLAQVGHVRLANVRGGTAAWQAAGLPLAFGGGETAAPLADPGAAANSDRVADLVTA